MTGLLPSYQSATVHELRSAAHAQAERGLRCSTKFITELLVSIAGDRVPAAHDVQNVNTEDEDERDCLLLAKAYFDTTSSSAPHRRSEDSHSPHIARVQPTSERSK